MLDTWKIIADDYEQFTPNAFAACKKFGENGETIYALGNPREGSLIALMIVRHDKPLIIWEVNGDR